MKKLVWIFLLAALFLCSCGKAEEGDKPLVVATLFPQYDFAQAIAGDSADVELLLDLGTDAHSYDPTPADMIKIANADLFIYTGDDMELWAKKLLESEDIARAVKSGELLVLDLSKHVTLLEIHEARHDHEHTGACEYDAHIWTSVGNAKLMCGAIYEALCQIDKDSDYKSNLENYTARLNEMAAFEKEIMERARLREAYFGGSFAFRYLFDELGISHSSVFEGCASHAEASAADIIAIADKVRASGASCVFYDSPSEKRIADTIAAECGIKVIRLHAIHNITKAEFESGENYISLMKNNIKALSEALS